MKNLLFLMVISKMFKLKFHKPELSTNSWPIAVFYIG